VTRGVREKTLRKQKHEDCLGVAKAVREKPATELPTSLDVEVGRELFGVPVGSSSGGNRER